MSLLHALSDDERVRRELSEAHDSAWQAALRDLEREGCVVRRGHGGTVREHGDGFVAAAFRHRTSRAQDPHLHTHVIVAKMACKDDGEWRALDGEALLKTYRLAAGYLYEVQLVRAVAGSLPEGAVVEQVLDAANELSRFPGVELVGDGEVPGRPARFTTRELLTVEQDALELALAGRDATVPLPERRPLAEALMLSGHELSGEQRMLVHQAACRPDRVVCVIGVAGSGKTLALHALADAYRGIDATALGAAPSGGAADELQTATGIRSRTLHRLLLDAQRDGGLPCGCVLVVDEARMAETRALAPLLRAVEEAEGKLLLVGGPGQLPAVSAGGLYRALCDRLGALELAGNQRQRDPLEREALAHLHAGNPSPTSPTPPATAASPSTTTPPRRKSGCSTTGGGKRNRIRPGR